MASGDPSSSGLSSGPSASSSSSSFGFDAVFSSPIRQAFIAAVGSSGSSFSSSSSSLFTFEALEGKYPRVVIEDIRRIAEDVPPLSLQAVDAPSSFHRSALISAVGASFSSSTLACSLSVPEFQILPPSSSFRGRGRGRGHFRHRGGQSQQHSQQSASQSASQISSSQSSQSHNNHSWRGRRKQQFQKQKQAQSQVVAAVAATPAPSPAPPPVPSQPSQALPSADVHAVLEQHSHASVASSNLSDVSVAPSLSFPSSPHVVSFFPDYSHEHIPVTHSLFVVEDDSLGLTTIFTSNETSPSLPSSPSWSSSLMDSVSSSLSAVSALFAQVHTSDDLAIDRVQGDDHRGSGSDPASSSSTAPAVLPNGVVDFEPSITDEPMASEPVASLADSISANTHPPSVDVNEHPVLPSHHDQLDIRNVRPSDSSLVVESTSMPILFPGSENSHAASSSVGGEELLGSLSVSISADPAAVADTPAAAVGAPSVSSAAPVLDDDDHSYSRSSRSRSESRSSSRSSSRHRSSSRYRSRSRDRENSSKPLMLMAASTALQSKSSASPSLPASTSAISSSSSSSSITSSRTNRSIGSESTSFHKPRSREVSSHHSHAGSSHRATTPSTRESSRSHLSGSWPYFFFSS